MLSICLALAGCGGGGGSGSAPVDFETYHAQIIGQGVTPQSLMPTGGTHNYAGTMVLNLPLGTAPRTAYEGDFAIGLAFGAGNVSGSGQASAFESADGTTLSGALTLGAVRRAPGNDPGNDYQLLADLDGQLSHGDADYTLSAQVAADLYGREADGIAGDVFAGTITSDALDVFDGVFAGQRVP